MNFIKCVFLLFVLLSVAACGGHQAIKNDPGVFGDTPVGVSDEINKQIISNAALVNSEVNGSEYYLGAGDVLELTVFQVEELNTKVRVNGRGEIILPLLGTVDVNGMSVSDAEQVIMTKLEKDYLQNPQVSVFVEDYRSQQIAVMGAVLKPDVYSIRQSRSIFEMLSLAGGLSDAASDKIRVKTTQVDGVSGESIQQELILSMKALLEGADVSSALRLRGGDSILVPEAGVVFVEGAVKKPGSYPMEGETNVLKAIALAGGVPWEGNQGAVQVIRQVGGSPYSIDVNLGKIRKQKSDDIELKDGDIVVVKFSAPKRFVTGFFNTVGRIVGYQVN